MRFSPLKETQNIDGKSNTRVMPHFSPVGDSPVVGGRSKHKRPGLLSAGIRGEEREG